MKRALLLVLATVVAIAAYGQDHPNDARGFAANRVYDFHDIDSVNLFNGNLNLRVPIGPEYRVSGLLSYRFMLTYNSHVWSYAVTQPPSGLPDCDTCPLPPLVARANPLRYFNAGLGWTLTLGRLDPPDESNAGVGTFVSPDGAQHVFYQHSNTDPGSPWFTHDGSYMRMEGLSSKAATILIHEPNGTTYMFRRMKAVPNGEWQPVTDDDITMPYRLAEILDAIGNVVGIRYFSTPSYKEIWKITDGTRENDVYFTDAGATGMDGVLDHIDLTSFNGKRETYTFNSHQETIARPFDDTSGTCPITVPFLDAFKPTDAAGFAFDYVTAPPSCDGDRGPEVRKTIGVLQDATLPTGGKIQWTYERFGRDGTVRNPFRTPAISMPVLVDTRTLVDRDGTPIGTWTYGRRYATPVLCTVQCPNSKGPCTSGRSRQLTAWAIEPPAEPGGAPRTTVTYYSDYELDPDTEVPRLTDLCPANGWDETQFGLPLTRYAASNGQFLSSEVRMNCNPALFGTWDGIGMLPSACGTNALTKFVTYEGDPFQATDSDNRLASETTYYGVKHDETSNSYTCDANCHYASMFNDNFDGAGHYRQTSAAALSSGISLSGSSFRTAFTNYLGKPADNQVWQLSLYTERCTADEATARTKGTNTVTSCDGLASSASDASPKGFERSAYQFDATTGLLGAQRNFAGASPAGNDVLTIFSYSSDHGDRKATESYGGDCAPAPCGLPTASLFSTSGLTPAYAVDETYQYNQTLLSAHTAHYRDIAPKTGVANFYTVNDTFDPSTTLPVASKDPAGLETDYTFDLLGRLTRVTPPAVNGTTLAPTTYTYTDATSTSPATVTATRTGSSGTLTQETYTYDGFGRLVTESRLMPDFTATKSTVLNAMGWPLRVSGFENGTPSVSFTSYSGYDAFGRATTITAPDQTSTTTVWQGNGVWQSTRSVKSPNAASPDYTTVEHRDDKGRLIAIEEESGANNALVSTTYGYDVADRLVSVNTQQQNRTFTYDGRGFLLAETHPEKNNLALTYGGYDARGHAHNKTEPGSSAPTLLYDYDGAERLTAVSVADPAAPGQYRIFKRFEFSSANAPVGFAIDYSLGKMFRSTRHNYLPNAQTVDYAVSETYQYAGAGGATSTKTTCIEDRASVTDSPCVAGAANGAATRQRVFTSAFTYDELGNPIDIAYPTCGSCTSAPPLRHELSAYANGFLTDVSSKLGSATPVSVAAGITYAPNGMVTSLTHPGGTVDSIQPDDHLMLRPQSITFSGWVTCARPVIVAQPAGGDLQSNPHLTLSVGVSGDGPFVYTWFQDGIQIQSGPLNTCSPGPVNTSAQFWVVVSNSCGSTPSAKVSVTGKCTPPQIVSQPAQVDVQVAPGTTGTATVYIVVSGTVKSVTWYYGQPGDPKPVPVPCTAPVVCTNNSLTLAGLTQSTSVWCTVASGNCDGTQSTTATKINVVTVCEPAAITSQPLSHTWAYSSNASTSVGIVVSGTSYTTSWLAKPDEVGASFGPCSSTAAACSGDSISVAPRETTSYRATVTDACTPPPNNTITSAVATITVTACESISVTSVPADARVVEGTPAILALNASLVNGNGNNGKSTALVATWYQGAYGDVSTPVGTVAGSSNLSFTTAPLLTDTQFWCRVAALKTDHSLTCAIDVPAVTITVCHKPRIVTQPQDAIVTPSQIATLSVVATGDGLSYQWYFGVSGDTSTPVPFADGRVLALKPLQPVAQYWVRISGECGTSDSRAATVAICTPPVITADPSDLTIIQGQSPQLSVVVDPAAGQHCNAPSVTPGVHYKWYLGTSAADATIVGGDAPALTLPTLTGGTTYSVWVVVSACGCSSESRHAQVYVCIPPVITTQPLDVETTAGQLALLTFTSDQPGAVGTWYQRTNGGPDTVIGTGSTLAVAPITTSTYFVRVSNGHCSTDSRLATVYACTPAIAAQPQSVGIVEGDPATLLVDAYGTAPLTYQWYIGATGDRSQPIPSSNSDSLVVSPAADTSYWVEISSPCATTAPTAQSATAVVTVCHKPAIMMAPTSTLITIGSQATLTVTATGTNIHYQWYVGQRSDVTAPIANTDRASINVVPSQTTAYWVRVTGDCGSADSDAATVTVCVPPVVSGPSDQLIVIGQTPTATLTVTADQPIASVDWYEGTTGNTVVPAGSGMSFTTPALTQPTTYWARVSNGQCSTDSRTATVSVCTPPAIVQPPVSTTTTSGQFVVLSVTAVGDGDLTYAWYQGKSGDTTTLLAGPDVVTTLGVAPQTTTDYWVRVSNGTCSSDSPTATISVCTPAITKQPSAATITAGDTASLSVAANGTAPLTVQWYAGQPGDTSNAVAGATSFTQSFSPGTTTTYWSRVATSCGFANSAAATVTVNPRCSPPVITATSQSAYLSGALLSVTVTGTAPQYQWFASDPAGSAWTPIANGTSNSIAAVPTSTVAYYYVRVSNGCGAVNSAPFTVNNTSCSLTITSDPVSQTYAAGAPVTLSVGATGNSLAFQWYGSDPDGSTYAPVAGATSDTLTILPSSPVASYYVVVTNGCGAMAQSAAATLTLAVCNAPAITQQPSSLSITGGSTTTLTASASGDAPLAFQWYASSDGATWSALAGQTASSLTVTPTTTSYYYVHVSNSCGAADSNYATVTVIPSGCAPPSIQTQPKSLSMQQPAPVTLSVVASGTGLTYQWYQSTSSSGGWTAVPNGTNASVTLTASYSPAYFYVQVRGTCGAVNSTIATVRTLWLECPPPTILTPAPQPITFTFGSSVTLTLSATGSDLRYVWFVSDPAGAPTQTMQNGASATFTYTPQTDGEVFVWARVYDDACGSYADSYVWTLYASNYCPVPQIATQPQSVTISAGQTATLSISVSSACQGQVTYQWYQADPGFGWVPIFGATSASVTVSPTQNEYYEVKVTNTQGTTATSNSALVTVQ